MTFLTCAVGSHPQGTIKCAPGAGVQELGSTSMRQYGFVVAPKPDTVPYCIWNDSLYLGSPKAITDSSIKQFALTDIRSTGIEPPSSDQNPYRPVNVRFLPCLDLPDTKLEHFVDKSIDPSISLEIKCQITEFWCIATPVSLGGPQFIYDGVIVGEWIGSRNRWDEEESGGFGAEQRFGQEMGWTEQSFDQLNIKRKC